MKSPLLLLFLVACGGVDDGGHGGGGPPTPSKCKNYQPPSLPDSTIVWHDSAAASKINSLTRFSVSGNSTFLDLMASFTYGACEM